jgi:hypothetical protein
VYFSKIKGCEGEWLSSGKERGRARLVFLKNGNPSDKAEAVGLELCSWLEQCGG